MRVSAFRQICFTFVLVFTQAVSETNDGDSELQIPVIDILQ